MGAPALLTEQQIRNAMSHTYSNRGAARYCNVSFPTYRLYASMYMDEKSGKNLYQLHCNKAGKQVPKFHSISKEPHLEKLLNEGMSVESYALDKFKARLLREGYVAQECSKCGFSDRRPVDFKVPLLLHFKNKIKSDWRLHNIEMLCYNCYYIHIADIFTKREEKLIEDYGAPNGSNKDGIKFELDEDLYERIEKYTRDPNRDGSEFISKY